MTTPRQPLRQPEAPRIQLVEKDGEVSLLIDDAQAMQGWERELMNESADLLCTYGSEFLEVGLGLGISALRIAGNPRTRRHLVIEKYPRVIELFRERHPALPPALEIVEADFFEEVWNLGSDRFDGIFFDPYLPAAVRNDQRLWDEVMPPLLRSLRPEGVFLPCFTTRPILYWMGYFDRAAVLRRPYTAYPSTCYTQGTSGNAYIQCYFKAS
jgi:hypothetical protein